MTNQEQGQGTADLVAARVQSALGDTYRLERELGGGGMSRVFLARDVSLSRDVVVKVLPEDVAEGLSRERFRREVLLSANLQHPNIVGVIAAGDAAGLPYFVMPYVEGESLRTKLTRDGALSVPHTVSILRDVARALAFAHERGVVHRDIKPDNVLLAGGAAIVADFGVAKALVSARLTGEHPHAGAITSIGVSLGTPAYMAPEQVAGDPNVDHRADLYSFGVMAYEMLVGRPPFAGRSVAEMMTAHLVEAPSPPSQQREGVPAALESLVVRCLAKDPPSRPANAAEILRVLDDPAVVSGAVTSAAVRSLPNVQASHTRRLWGAALAGALLVGVLSWVLLRDRGGVAARPAARAAAPALPTVAVLPLVSVSPDSADAYIALGMSDEITNALSRVPGLRVASRSSAAAAQAEEGSVADVARRIGVSFLLEGTVQRAGERLRVSVRLVSASDGFTTWSDVYERTTKDLFAVQADIADAIASAVRADVASTPPGDSSSGAPKETRDPEAYNDFLRGHYLLARRGEEALRGAIEAFEKAIARDPGFARAYAELAQAYAVLPLHANVSRDEVWPKALYAAERALALDSTLAAAHAAMGNIYNSEWRWRDARQSLERAIALDSSYASAYQWLAENHLANGDAETAVRLLGVASRKDPAAPIITAVLGVAQGVARQFEPALQSVRAAVSREPSLVATRVMLGTVLLYSGRAVEAVTELEAADKAAPDLPLVLGALGNAYGRAGRRADANAIRVRLEAMTPRAGVYPALAKVHLGLGENDKAIDALTWAAASRDDFFAAESMASPLFDALRGDPRFARVVGVVGLDVAQLTRPRR